MRVTKLSQKDLYRELVECQERFPKLANDELFVLWFLRAYVAEDENEAASSLCGGPGDKGVDAVLIDEATRNVCIIQGKYRKSLAVKNENRADVVGFAQLAANLSGDGAAFSNLCKNLSPAVHQRLVEARNRIQKRGYRLQLYYVTMGKCSPALRDEVKRIVRTADCPASIQVVEGRQVLLILSDYLDGVAPPVPSLDLEIESGHGIRASGVLQRYDSKTDIESWVFSITDQTVTDLYGRAGVRLFARNVRGFLGSTEINRRMEGTLSHEPEFFWYYNNGITIICDNAERISSRGRDVLRVMNPQVINGQQTTRTLARQLSRGSRASVLVRVIRVPRDVNRDSNHFGFETLVSQIVSATNSQNAIRPSDLMSNDRRQIEIERALRKLGYWYVRKRQTKSEAKRSAGSHRYFMVKKDELAQSVAGCDLDPAVVREGKERLFEERWYSHVFPTADPFYYLSRYLLMRAVGYAASGFPERAYAKWMVLNFMWSRLSPLVRSRSSAENFRLAWERDRPPLDALDRTINAAFNSALRFYRLRRGKGAKAQDVSTFFMRKGLHREFEKFWRGSSNKSRPAFGRAWSRFEKLLAAEASK